MAGDENQLDGKGIPLPKARSELWVIDTKGMKKKRLLGFFFPSVCRTGCTGTGFGGSRSLTSTTFRISGQDEYDRTARWS
ncbi:hypothetical protein BP00DRAFT_193649 [Aspergillus indologenus CBS 114.80]|uniref:Uncharacterized protein n=1 Tax=Aspergillus indologenus CBS 114.80 TaxID=1450541 RepID=A0A2V5J1V4_9EURO|nr:hypothetical protein BP00DRAFT_193649 [Aspergillus indologenus CBS 114.80]